MKRSYIKRGTKTMKHTKLRVAGHSTVSELKREIQALLRQIVIQRDGGCILRSKRRCGGDIGKAVLQADHLISRSNSATYADSRLVVCVCKPCHAWKSLGGDIRKLQYDELVKTMLSKKIIELWERQKKNSWMPVRTGESDWKLAILALKKELNG